LCPKNVTEEVRTQSPWRSPRRRHGVYQEVISTYGKSNGGAGVDGDGAREEYAGTQRGEVPVPRDPHHVDREGCNLGQLAQPHAAARLRGDERVG